MGYRPTISNDPVVLRSGAVTTSFVASSVELRTKGFNALALDVDVTLDTSTSVEVQLHIANPAGDTAPTSTDWYVHATGLLPAPAAGVTAQTLGATNFSFAATGRYQITVPNLVAKYIRVSVKGTAGPGTTTATVRAVSALV